MRIEGHADPAVTAQADGESLGLVRDFTIDYEADALEVLVPAQDRRAS